MINIKKAIERIKETNSKLVCIQLPDGLKPQAKEIQSEIEAKTDSKVIIWAGSCFGACDIPLHIDRLGIDLLIHFGHTEWQ